MTEPTPDRPHEELDAPPPPEGVLDRARLAALDAFDERHASDPPADGNAGETPPADPAVADLGARRRRRSWATAGVPLGAVAAALLLVALVGVFVTQLDVGDTDDMDTAADSLEDSADDGAAAQEASEPTTLDGADEQAEDDAAFDSSGAPAARMAYLDLDAFLDDLRDAPAANEAESTPLSTTTVAAAGAGCDPVNAATVDPGTVVRIVPATVDGRPVVAVVYDPEGAPDGAERAAVVDEGSCSLLEDRLL